MKKAFLLSAMLLFLCPAIGMSAFTTSKSSGATIGNRNYMSTVKTETTYRVTLKDIKPEPITVKAGNKYICIMTVDVIVNGQTTQTGTAVCSAPAMAKCPDAQTCGEDKSITDTDWDFAKVGGV
jgi:hypothetical protein